MKLDTIPNINYLWSGLIIEELRRNGIVEFCIAPGSRSTPLTLSAAGCDEVPKTIHFDERGLGFYALGISSGGKGPPALISTSGTAAANFFPAVIEASKKKVPLIILTADRPPELRKTGALQTIDQPGIFGKYVKWEFDLPAPDSQIDPEMVLTTIDQAVFMAVSGTPGPVHLNCMFREPLAPEKVTGDWMKNRDSIEIWLNSNTPYTRYIGADERLSSGHVDEIINIINRSVNGVIVAGKLKSGESDQVKKLAEKLKWPVFPDLTSGLRFDNTSDHIIHYFDQVLLSGIWDKDKIDTVLHLGGRITSKRYYQFIEKAKPENYISVLNHPLRNDPLHIVSHRVKSSVSAFIEAVISGVKFRTTGTISGRLMKSSKAAGNKIDDFFRKSDVLSEIFVARAVSMLIGRGGALFLSNSMPVRDMDMYASPINNNLLVSGNRGASGIDGIVASAAGFANAVNAPLTLIIGDLAFLHDMNSLALIKACKNQIIIIIINNNGGAIFSFLPVASYRDHFDKYFTTPHGMSFENAGKQFGIDYIKVSSKKEFSELYSKSVENGESLIIEVAVDRGKNMELHKELQSVIKKELDQFGSSEGG